MAAPVLIGIPWLAEIMAGLIGALVTFFTTYIGKKVAFGAAILTSMAALFLVLVATLKALALGISYAVPSELSLAASWVIPDNFNSCLGAIISAQLVKWGWEWKVWWANSLKYA